MKAEGPHGKHEKELVSANNLNKPVLKYRFMYYLSKVRTTDQETMTIEKIICYSQLPRGGSFYTTQGHIGKNQVTQEAEKAETMWAIVLHCSLVGKERSRQGKQAWHWPF